MMEKYKYELDGQIIEVSNINEIPNGLSYEAFEEIENSKVPQKTELELEIIRNIAREKDGIEEYRNTQTQLRLARLNAPVVISDDVYDEFVYFPMDKTIQAVRSGNWLSAKNALALVQPTQYLTAEMILMFKIKIANYIVNSGNYIEYTGKSVDPLTGIIS